MNRGRCPKCKSRIRRKLLYNFFCDSCNVGLSETQSSTYAIICIGMFSLLGAIVIGYFGTVEIVNFSEGSQPLKKLVIFYLKLLGGVTLVSMALEHIYIKYFGSYGSKR